MSIHPSSQGSGFSRPQRQLTKVTRLPAPRKGMDLRLPLSEMSQENCVFAYNITPSDYGMDVRPGYREWQIDVENTTNLGVKTLIWFEGSADTLADDKLFAVNNEGIWDVTVRDGTPLQVFTFVTDTSAEAGQGVFVQYTEDSGAQWILYADSKNGLLTYELATDTWAAAAGITGVAVADIVFVAVHKQRVWMLERDSATGWYLPIGAKAGAATAFYFGSKFTHGGRVEAVINWTIDGGTGVDDYLVVVGSGGDLLPYKGTDPADSSWEVVGSYYIGAIPVGRRFFGEYSGELYLLSSFGLISMGDLLRGVTIRSITSGGLTAPISELIRRHLSSTNTDLGWEVKFVPSLSKLLISTPVNAITGSTVQYVMNLTVEGWGIWRGVPMTCLEDYRSTLYFGTLDGKIQAMDSINDKVLLDTADPSAGGTSVEFSLLTGYSSLGSVGRFKMGQYVRPDFIAHTPPTYKAKFFYDYDIAEEMFAVGFVGSGFLTAVWDSSLWDGSLWGAGHSLNYNKLQGQSGIGRYVAVALRGESSDRTKFISFDVLWKDGGPT